MVIEKCAARSDLRDMAEADSCVFNLILRRRNLG
jgi:hypothetical protein